jgi:hypothetical protein
VAEAWLLRGFQERLDEWIDLEHPEDWLRVIVVNWVLSRIDDPYVGMRREGGFANLWFGVIPGTGDFAEGVASSVPCGLRRPSTRCAVTASPPSAGPSSES